jgi:raffinose/stachyose/melibiose transport system permease protein
MGGRRITIRNNILYNGPTEHIIARPQAGGAVPIEDLVIENNFFGPVLNGSQSINIGTAPDRCRNVVIQNNTVAAGVVDIDCVAPGGGPSTSVGHDAREGRAMARPGSEAIDRGYLPFLIPGVILFLAVIVVPFVMNVAVSFTTWTGVGRPEWVGLDNYLRLFQDDTFWASFRNIMGMLVAMVIIPTLIGLFLAAVLFDYIGKKLGDRPASMLRAGFYLPQVLPVAIAGVVWGWILHPTYGALNMSLRALGLEGLTHNWLGDHSTALLSVMAVMIWFQVGYPVVIFMAGLQRVDPELYEAAELDGAGWLQRFRHITVQLIRPEIFVVVLTTTIAALKVFGPIYVLTRGGPGNATTVPSYFAYQNFFERARVGYGASIATVLTVIVLAFTIVFLGAQSREDLREAS